MNPARLVRRLRAMDGRELRFRSASAARRTAGRIAFAVRRPVWQRSTFASIAWGPETIDRAIAHARQSDWPAAHADVMRHVGDGGCRFVLDPRRRDEIARLVIGAFPTAPSEAVDRAERVLSGRFDLLGYRGLSFAHGESAIDWHYDPVHGRRAPRVFWDQVPYLAPECGDHKIIWELNRHQHWLTLGRAYWLTGDRRFRDGFVDQLYGWLDANPPLDGINWASMLELALRSLSWIWALHFFSAEQAPDDARPWSIDLMVALDRQLRLVERNLSRYFSPNTHLLGEALALYVAGRTLPLRRSPRWADLGGRVLVGEIDRQINPDGGHAELSTHYHRYTLDMYLMALAIARETQDAAAIGPFAEAVERLAGFARTIADDQGRLPNIGDEDGGALFPLCGRSPADASDSLHAAALLLGRPDLRVGRAAEEAIWLTGQLPASAPAPSWPSAALRQSGYFVSRPSAGDVLTIDAGPHGFLNGGHAHADALAIVATVRSRPFLVDPGTGGYTVDAAARDRFRSSVFHNTLTLDERSQSIPDGPFHWRSTANATALAWVAEEGFDYFEGQHDAYAPAVHHRSVLSQPDCWTIVDRVISNRPDGAPHRADIHWHIDPSWRVTPVHGNLLEAVHHDGTTVWMAIAGDDVSVQIFRGSADGDRLGWYSPVYGTVLPTTTVRITSRRTTPIVVSTAIVTADEPPRVERTDVEGHPDAVGLLVSLRGQTNTMVFVPSTSSHADRAWRTATLESDARVLCWRAAPGNTGTAVANVGGTFVRDRSAAPLRPSSQPRGRAATGPRERPAADCADLESHVCAE
jgi:hypothetical protein